MQQYILHYDAAAIVLLLVLIFDYRFRKTIRTELSEIFEILLYLGISVAVLDIVASIVSMHSRQIPLFWGYLVNTIYFLFLIIMPMIYCTYSIRATGIGSTITRSNQILLTLPAVLEAILILSNGKTNFIFSMNRAFGYHRNPGILVLYSISAFYVCLSMYFVRKNRNLLSPRKRRVMYFYSLITLAFIGVQLLFPRVLLTSFGFALAIYLMYTTLENPEYYTDSDLSVYNRKGFQLLFNKAMDSRENFTVLAMEIRNLKEIRENLATDNSSEILQEFVKFLKQNTQKNDIFIWETGRFAILSSPDQEDWKELILALGKRLRTPFMVRGSAVNLDVSLFTIHVPEDVQNVEDAIELMRYSFKSGDYDLSSGQERITKMHRRDKIVEIMKKALAEGTFEVYYQPIYSVKEKRFTTAEALVRLKDPELGFISPDEFIPLAEENGLILKIGELVFRKVCELMANTRLWENGITDIDVNLSVVQTMQKDLATKYLAIMDEIGLAYEHISLEITETAAVASKETLRSNIEIFAKKGIKFAMDDYGTGFSNILTLVDYPFDIIKVDKSLVWSADTNPKACSVLRESIQMSKEMNMMVIAEGVETQEQAQQLMDFGCDYFQGFFYAKPMPAEAFVKLICETNGAKEVASSV